MPNNTNQTTAGGFQTSDEMDPAWIGILEALILFVIMMVAVIGNFLVIAVVYRRRELRRTETHIFIVNLSLTDISVALLCMPFSMLTAVTQKWIFSDALCQLNGFLNVFFLLTSILTLTAISIHKYIGVVQPTKRKIFTRKRTIMAVIWVWLQALLTALTPIFGWNDYEHISGRTQCSVKVPRENKLSELTNCLFIIITGFVIPLGIMSFSYLKIFQTVQIHTKRVRSHSFGEEQSQSAFLNERRITITLFIILAVFLACWSPFSILTIYATLAGNELSKYFSVAAYWLGFLNSAMNPLIYALRTREFRQGYREILGIILPCCFAKIDSRDSDSLAVLRGRRSIKSEVMAYSKRRRAGTKTENYVSEAPVDVKNGAIKGKHRKDTLTVELETKDESESVRYETASEFSIRNKEISEIQDSYYSAKRTTSVGEDNCVKIQDVALHHREVTEGAPLSSDSDVSLSLTRESLLLPWNSTNVLGEQTFPKNFEEDAKSRRKSLSFLSIFHEKPDLIKSRQLYRSKSDCSSAVQSPVGGHSCPNVDLRNPQSSNPWLRENLSYLDRISPIHLEDSCG